MSLALDVDLVTAVNIGGTWYEVANDSFTLDSYEFLWWSPNQHKHVDDPLVLHGGGQSGVSATGFQFETPEGDYLAGPLTSIQAVRTDLVRLG